MHVHIQLTMHRLALVGLCTIGIEGRGVRADARRPGLRPGSAGVSQPRRLPKSSRGLLGPAAGPRPSLVGALLHRLQSHSGYRVLHASLAEDLGGKRNKNAKQAKFRIAWCLHFGHLSWTMGDLLIF